MQISECEKNEALTIDYILKTEIELTRSGVVNTKVDCITCVPYNSVCLPKSERERGLCHKAPVTCCLWSREADSSDVYGGFPHRHLLLWRHFLSFCLPHMLSLFSPAARDAAEC